MKKRQTTYDTSSDDDYYPSANNRRNSNFNNIDKSNSPKLHGKNVGRKNKHHDEDDDDEDDDGYDDYDNNYHMRSVPTVEATVIPYDIDNSGEPNR